MRIALIGPVYPYRGGIAHYTTMLCRALRGPAFGVAIERESLYFLLIGSSLHRSNL